MTESHKAPPAAGPNNPTSKPILACTIGAVGLLTAMAASLAMGLKHLSAIELPGCGPGSGCDEVAKSVWATIPLINWPVAHLGLAYFTAAAVAWLAGAGRLPALLRNIVRLGMLGSVTFTIVMLVEQHVCKWCLATHIGNLLFWLSVESTRRLKVDLAKPAVIAAAVFVLITGGAAVEEYRHQAARQESDERSLDESVEAIISATTQETAAPAIIDEPNAPTTTTAATTPSPISNPFTGRWRLGPEKAAIRMVVLSDYQCKDCKRIEADIMRVFESRNDMSVSAKHFPMSTDCNKHFSRNMHPNACWAARAAEAAGILRGNDGFWEMHKWLFEHGGGFTRAELRAALTGFGYDVPQFESLMQGQETLARIESDIEEGNALGLHYTPMVFINGVEFKGVFAPNAIQRGVERIAAANPPVAGPGNDHPVLALEKYVADWRDQPARNIPPETEPWFMGDADASVTVELWGDFQEPYTAQADAIVRQFVADHGNVQYAFRHFPFDRDCNTALKVETRHPLACEAARAAEAAGRLGGSAAYWKMHVWLMEHQDSFSLAAA
ncbi:MAG: thioredoxin domain-containing protein, partial [Phycisphaerae bacterium]|nr:thioredoxin domain-containing protein [Phycisphaerae bacterium]